MTVSRKLRERAVMPEVAGAATIAAANLRHALAQLTAHYHGVRCAVDQNIEGAAAHEAALTAPLLLLDEALDEAEYVAAVLAENEP